MLILFGRSFSGGLLVLLKSEYKYLNTFSPDRDEIFVLQDLEFSTNRQPLFIRIIKTISFLSSVKTQEVVLTHSIQALMLPILFKRKSFKWVCQGVEILGNNKYLDRFAKVFLLKKLKRSNLEISIVNESLEVFFQKIDIDTVRDKSIWISYPEFRSIKGVRKVDLLFVLRSERCKNSKLALELFRRLEDTYNCIVVNVMNVKIGSNSEILGRISRQEMEALLLRTKWIVYTSFFEGYGLLVKEAMELGTGAIVGPDILLGYQSEVGFVRNETYNIEEWLQNIAVCLGES